MVCIISHEEMNLAVVDTKKRLMEIEKSNKRKGFWSGNPREDRFT